MTERSVNGRVPEDSPDSSESDSGTAEDDVVRGYAPWVSVFAFLHRYLGRPTVVFVGSGVVGALVLVRQFYAFASEPTEWSGLPSWTVIVGVGLFGFGVAYYVVRDGTACSECGTPFSRRRTGKHPVSKSTDGGPDRAYLQATYECSHCGEETTELYSQSEWNYTRY